MTGIFGVLQTSPGGPPPSDALHRLAAAAGSWNGSGRDAVTGPPITVGRVGLGARGGPGVLAGVAEATAGGRRHGLSFCGSLYEGQAAVADPDVRLKEMLEEFLRRGLDALSDLRGDFVLAYYDGRRDILHLACDRFRVQPLFYAESDRGMAFASRLRWLARGEISFDRSVLPEAVVDLVAGSYIPTPRTIYRGARKVPPAHVVSFADGHGVPRAYWDLDFRRPDRRSQDLVAADIRGGFEDAVAVRLATDEPWTRPGTFLSGGVDSSTVTGVLGRQIGSRVRSFSIGFAERRFNEIDYARVAARAFGAEHHEYFVTPQDVLEFIPALVEAFDEPFANASAVPTYFCAREAARAGVSVLYAGDGGDELFAGNERYARRLDYETYLALPTWMRRGVLLPMARVASTIPIRLTRRVLRYAERAEQPYPVRMTSHSFFRVHTLASVFDPAFLRLLPEDYAPYQAIERLYQEAPADHDLDRELYIDLKLAIGDNDLLKVTRMCEAAGIVVRFPFLDHRFAESAATVPATMKMRGRQLRTFFKETYADLLPEACRTKTKHGFGLPIAPWLRADPTLRALLTETLGSQDAHVRAYFRTDALDDLIRRHADDPTTYYGTILWNVLMLELWLRREKGSAHP